MKTTVNRKPSFRAFSLVEVIVSLFILAILAGAVAVLVANRDSARDETAAIGAAPAAIDALEAALHEEGAAALNATLAGDRIRILWRDAAADGAPWRCAMCRSFSGTLSASGPVFAAKLENGKLRADGRALELDVVMTWIIPGPAETAETLVAKAVEAKEICRYRTIVLDP